MNSESAENERQLSDAEVLAKFKQDIFVSYSKDGQPVSGVKRWKLGTVPETGRVTILIEADDKIGEHSKWQKPNAHTIEVLNDNTIQLTTKRSVYALGILDESDEQPEFTKHPDPSTSERARGLLGE